MTQAGAGALSGELSGIGINDAMMKDLAASFTPDSSALFVLVRRGTTEGVIEELKPFAGKGKVLRTSLKKGSEDASRHGLGQARFGFKRSQPDVCF